MAKTKSSLTNMVVVLVGFALAIAALLAWVNHVTEGPIPAKAEKTLADGIKKVMAAGDIKVTKTDTVRQMVEGKENVYVVYSVADKAGGSRGAAVECATLGFGGNMRVLVGFDNGGNILGYSILEHSETPGLGAKAQAWFQKGAKGDIIGMNPAKGALTVTKDGGQVDAITASTITSRAFLKAVNEAYKAYAAKTNGQRAANE